MFQAGGASTTVRKCRGALVVIVDVAVCSSEIGINGVVVNAGGGADICGAEMPLEASASQASRLCRAPWGNAAEPLLQRFSDQGSGRGAGSLSALLQFRKKCITYLDGHGSA